jgi:hypothetical protein
VHHLLSVQSPLPPTGDAVALGGCVSTVGAESCAKGLVIALSWRAERPLVPMSRIAASCDPEGARPYARKRLFLPAHCKAPVLDHESCSRAARSINGLPAPLQAIEPPPIIGQSRRFVKPFLCGLFGATLFHIPVGGFGHEFHELHEGVGFGTAVGTKGGEGRERGAGRPGPTHGERASDLVGVGGLDRGRRERGRRARKRRWGRPKNRFVLQALRLGQETFGEQGFHKTRGVRENPSSQSVEAQGGGRGAGGG